MAEAMKSTVLFLLSGVLAVMVPPAASSEPGPGPLITEAAWETHSHYYPQSPLCESHEVTLWSCQAQDREHALCSSREMTRRDGHMQYRASGEGAAVSVYPAARQPPAGLFDFMAFSNGDASIVFEHEGDRYTLVDALRGDSAVMVDAADGTTARTSCGSNQTLQVNYSLRLMHDSGIWKRPAWP